MIVSFIAWFDPYTLCDWRLPALFRLAPWYA
jgi:hypothetical protein